MLSYGILERRGILIGPSIVTAAESSYGGDTMPKERYVKPEIRSEELEPGALACVLSGVDDGDKY